jgi:hypothetical protein
VDKYVAHPRRLSPIQVIEQPLINFYVTSTAAVLISLEANPTTFAVFNTTSTGEQLPFAVPFFSAAGEGPACIPVDIASLNIPGVQDGSNVTLQIQFNGGDGDLFQVSHCD